VRRVVRLTRTRSSNIPSQEEADEARAQAEAEMAEARAKAEAEAAEARAKAEEAKVPFTFAEWISKARQSGHVEQRVAAMRKLEQAGELLETLVPLEVDTEVRVNEGRTAWVELVNVGRTCERALGRHMDRTLSNSVPRAHAWITGLVGWVCPQDEQARELYETLVKAIELIDTAQDELDASQSSVDRLVDTFIEPPPPPTDVDVDAPPELGAEAERPPRSVMGDILSRVLWGSTTLQLSETGQVREMTELNAQGCNCCGARQTLDPSVSF
jgi:hypothetical protein